MYADTCGKASAVASSNIKSQDVSQIKLLICITNQVASHCAAEITRRAAQTPQTQKVPIRGPHQNRHVRKSKKARNPLGLSLQYHVAMSVLHGRTSNYISEGGFWLPTSCLSPVPHLWDFEYFATPRQHWAKLSIGRCLLRLHGLCIRRNFWKSLSLTLKVWVSAGNLWFVLCFMLHCFMGVSNVSVTARSTQIPNKVPCTAVNQQWISS